MSYHIKLKKALSYSGIVKATKDKPDVYVDDKETADKAIASGYFELVADDGEDTGDDIPDGITGDSDDGEDDADGKTIDKMTVAELETFAAYKNVSLKGITGKKNIIEKLREELGDEAINGIIEYGSPTMVELQSE